jgi:hypothetical protein
MKPKIDHVEFHPDATHLGGYPVHQRPRLAEPLNRRPVTDAAQRTTVAESDTSLKEIGRDETVAEIARRDLIAVSLVIGVSPVVNDIIPLDWFPAQRTPPRNMISEATVVVVFGSVRRVLTLDGSCAICAGKMVRVIKTALGFEVGARDVLAAGSAD